MTEVSKKGRGGARPGAGRKRGVLTKRTVVLAEALTAKGETPLEVMLTVMRALFKDRHYLEAVAIAEKAAPYVHPRLSAANITVKTISQMTDEDLLGEESVSNTNVSNIGWRFIWPFETRKSERVTRRRFGVDLDDRLPIAHDDLGLRTFAVSGSLRVDAAAVPPRADGSAVKATGCRSCHSGSIPGVRRPVITNRGRGSTSSLRVRS
jgi:hypothetical protein